MKRYCIYAAEQQYSGLHGMFYREVIEAFDQDEAEDYGRDCSFGVMNDYDDIVKVLEENAAYWTSQNYEEGSKEWEKAYNDNLEQEYNDNIDYYIKEIDGKKVNGISLEVLDTMYNNDPEEFEEEYCINE